MPKYKPYEEQQLESLIPALNQGMDPTTAYSIFSGLQGGAVERAMQQKAQRQAALQQAMAQMQEYATAGENAQGLEALMGSYQSAFPGLNRPKLDARLEGTLESLIPAGQGRSPLFTGMPPEPMAPGEEGPLTPGQVRSLSQEPESVQAIYQEASDLATGVATGAPVPLHDARMRIMTKLRNMGYPESTLNEAYTLIGNAYDTAVQSGGGARKTLIGGTPLSMKAKRSLSDLAGLSGTAHVGIG